MSVTHCFICDKNPIEAKRLGGSGFGTGETCPLCYRPTCSHHLTTVRWRWRKPMRELASAQICLDCKRTYKHRDWDPINRDWIS